MKKQKGTISILESIRNKMHKIEKNNAAAIDPQSDSDDDFEYIDSSKDIIDSKNRFKIPNTQETSDKTNNDPDKNSDDMNFSASEDNLDIPLENLSTAPDNTEIEQNLDQRTTDNDLKTETKSQDQTLDLKNDSTIKKDIEEEDLETLQRESLKKTDELEDFEEDLEKPATPTPQTAEEPKADKIEEIDDLAEPEDLEELGEKDDDIDFDMTDLEEEATNTKTEEIKTLEDFKEVNEAEDIETDDNLDDLDLDNLDDIEEEAQATNKSLEEESTQQDIAADADLDDFNLDEEMNSSAPQTTESNTINQTENNLSNPINKNTMISENAAQKATDSIKELIGSIPKKQQFLSGQSPAFKSGEIIEDMVAGILAPRLEQWLNDNLPSMVEKIVREEIKKLVPKNHQD